MDPYSVTMELRSMMTDPSKVNFRVFVGCIPTDSMLPQELAELLSTYGEVEGVLLNKGFGFVQFKKEQSAKDVVAANGRILFRGRRIDVKPARPLKRGSEDVKEVLPTGYLATDKGREPTRFPVATGRFSAGPAPTPNVERANDCEIIVVNKAQTEYAEYIEQKLRRLGLTVDLLFPNDDVPVTRVLTNIANRGCLFAVVVMPQNEEHRSMTLNILHGPPQEHRNMPLEDAVALVSRSFEAYIVREKATRPVEVPIVAPVAAPIAPTLADRHPENIQILLNLLAENRMLTVIQYDKIITYLQGRRELQVKVEVGDAAAVPTVPPTLSLTSTSSSAPEKQNILQSRILSILNKASSNNTQVVNSAKPSPTPASQAQLLQDPTVQKALSSIMQGDILRKISESSK